MWASGSGEEAGARDADLPGVEEHSPGGGLRDFIHVDIRHHDHRRLAPELEGDALQCVGGIAVDDLADLGRAGESDLIDVRVLHQAIACGVAVAGDDVDDSRREAGLRHEVGEAQRGDRCLLGGFEDQRAAGGERR